MPPKTVKIRDRIKGFKRIKASELLPNPENWRTHPQAQRDAMAGILSEVGYVDAIMVRKTEAGYQIIDGHLRAETSADAEVPCLIVDLDDEEAAKVLATFDPLAAMAETDAAALDALLLEIETDDEALKQLLAGLVHDSPRATEPEIAQDRLDEQSTKLAEFIERRRDSQARGNDKADANFWVCLVFQSWDQKQEFLFAIQDVPVLYGMYADGQTLAQRLGYAITPNAQREIQSHLDKKLVALVDVEQG